MKESLVFAVLSGTLFAAACGSAVSTPNANTSNSTNAGNGTSNQAPAAQQNSPAKTPEAKESKKADQTVERVNFGAGKEDGSWTRDIPAEGSMDFMVNAKQGQTFGFQVGYEGKASDIQAFLTEPGLQDITIQAGPEERKEFKTKQSGDHRITVNNMSKKKVTMTLYIDIR